MQLLQESLRGEVVASQNLRRKVFSDAAFERPELMVHQRLHFFWEDEARQFS